MKAVIFDLDGCLVDSEPHALEAIAAEMRALGVKDASAEEIGARFLGVSLSVIHAYVAERSGRPTPADFTARFEGRLFEVYQTELRQIAGAEALLQALQAAGVQMAIATGGSLKRLGVTLQTSGLARYFEGRAFSADQVARGKPAPDLFELAARELGVSPADCVVLEDSPHGVEGALAAGMQAVGFVGGSHLDGRRAAHAALLSAKGAREVLSDMAGMFTALTGKSLT